MRRSFAVHIADPTFGGGCKNRIIVDGAQQKELIDVRRVVVPSRQIRGSLQGEMAQVVSGPRARVVQSQHALKRVHTLIEQLRRFFGVPTSRQEHAFQIIKPDQRVDESVQNERRRRRWILFVPDVFIQKHRCKTTFAGWNFERSHSSDGGVEVFLIACVVKCT